MNWAKIIALVVASVVAAGAQQPEPPPQTARQGLLEMFFGKDPKAFAKHVPETVLEVFGKADTGLITMVTRQVSGIQSELSLPGSHLETFEAGPLLLLSERLQENHQERVEITVERDDLSGDTDEIELALHVYKDGTLDRLPVVPGLVLDLKEEKDVWRLTQITLALRVPLSDPEYIQGIAEDMRRTRQRMAEYQTLSSLQSLKALEAAQQKKSSSYTCDLESLGKGWESTPLEPGGKPVYILKITNCSSSSFNIIAEPVNGGPARRALCMDESGAARFAEDGKGSTCLSNGRSIDELESGSGRVRGFGPVD